MITDVIMEYKKKPDAKIVSIGKYVDELFNNQFVNPDREGGSKVYASNVGGCVRKLAYSVLDFPAEGKEIDQRARNIFFTGGMWEIVVIELAKLAGFNVTECLGDQIKHKLKCGPYEITVMPDGKVNIDGEDYTLEVKSMNSFSFKDFQKRLISDEYKTQIQLGMEVQGTKKAILIAVDKVSGFMDEILIHKDNQAIMNGRVSAIMALSATKENLPDRKYLPNDKGFLQWQCRYCAYWKACYPDAKVMGTNGAIKANLKEISNAV